MKPRRSNQRNRALTLVEVMVIIAVLVIFVVLFLPLRSTRIPLTCVGNLHQISAAFRIWADDNNGKYPMEISRTNGGALEPAATGNVAPIFHAMSNELSTPKVLLCPADTRRVWATDFSKGFDNSHISYCVGLNRSTNDPQAFLSGDDDLAVNGTPAKSGLLEFSTNNLVAWGSGRHVSPNSHFWTAARDKFVGNICMTDGSIRELSTLELQQMFQQTGLATNRLAIP